MICPNCMVQMHQEFVGNTPIGGGEATDQKYTTWTVQVCPQCGRRVREYYEAKVLQRK